MTRDGTGLALAIAAALLGAPAQADDAADDAPDDAPGPASGDDAGGEDPADDDPLSPYRTPFGVLLDRTIGSTSRPVAFNWRRTRVQLAATGSHLFELNNFNSLRAGAVARFPTSGLLYEIGLNTVWVWDTPSSELLALTPYRQPGRPARAEIDFNVVIPLAEGVVTTRARFFPALEMVFSGYAGIRYAIYPNGFGGMKVGEVATAILSPALTETELENLDDWRLDAMEVDPARYGLLLGLGDDIYFKQGIFISPRVMVSLPVLAPVAESDLLFWGDFSLLVGVAF